MIEIPLYHGTDKRMLLMSPKERELFINNCDKVIDFLWDIFAPYLERIPQEKIIEGQKNVVYELKIAQIMDTILDQCGKTIWNNFYAALFCIQGYKKGTNNFQYGHLYLTGDKNKAINYATRSFAGGERGLFAYRLIQVSEKLGLINNASVDVIESISVVKQFAESNPQPIILKVSNIDYNNLLQENGKPIESDMPLFLLQGISYRYTKPYTLRIEDSIDLIEDNC